MMAGFPVIKKIIVISSDQTDWNLITDGFGGIAPLGVASVLITINAGVVMRGAAAAALDLRGLPDGSSIRIINNGESFGAGGGGGTGGSVDTEDGS